MKLYIVPPTGKGEGVYRLLAETGEYLAHHHCSHWGFAKGDLLFGRVDRFTKRFGNFDVVWIGDDEMTEDKLYELNQALCSEPQNEDYYFWFGKWIKKSEGDKCQ